METEAQLSEGTEPVTAQVVVEAELDLLEARGRALMYTMRTRPRDKDRPLWRADLHATWREWDQKIDDLGALISVAAAPEQETKPCT
ncbi:hypothetical protein [Streptacidiphilus sp. EB129]|uniref:hypothetical protein n=1 Tax=Streptacidiphilus sp. EB129 TaxID=3156262 RepID=UPI0035147906